MGERDDQREREKRKRRALTLHSQIDSLFLDDAYSIRERVYACSVVREGG